MKAVLLLCVIAVATVGAQLFDEESEGYILDAQAFKDLFDCVMDFGPCSDKQQIYRDMIPRYTKTLCSDCHPNERALFHKYDAMIAERYPDLRKQVRDKFMDNPTYEVMSQPLVD